jgi:hypothetical protein
MATPKIARPNTASQTAHKRVIGWVHFMMMDRRESKNLPIA